jgi:nitric oxide dioxygenase
LAHFLLEAFLRGVAARRAFMERKVTPQQIELIQASFEKAAPHSELAAEMFYGRLFQIAPHVKPLFKGDIKEQGRKLMAALAMVVNSLDNLDAVVPVAKSLANKHVTYGVKRDDYQPVGEALIWTLSEALGDSFTPETRDAWLAAYTILAGVMMAEAYGPVAA